MNISFEYAKALFELALGNKNEEDTLRLLNESILAFDKDNFKYFIDPRVTKDNKKEIISKVINDETYKHFLFVLIDNNRFNELVKIKNEYELLLLKYQKTKKVFVYSKEKLSDDYLLKLKQKLEKRLSSKLLIENVIDLNVQYGIRIIYDSKEIDFTTNSKLNDLSDSLKESYGTNKR